MSAAAVVSGRPMVLGMVIPGFLRLKFIVGGDRRAIRPSLANDRPCRAQALSSA